MSQTSTSLEQKQAVGLYDLTNLGKMKDLGTLAPEAMAAFVAFEKAALADGTIPKKYKELIALGVACTTQCPYFINIHTIRRAGRLPSAIDRAEASAVSRKWRRCMVARRSMLTEFV